MNEMFVIDALKGSGTDIIASLPCDRNKALTKALHDNFHTIDLTREEDGVGICAGAFLAGGKPALSIQSSGIGNMMNALMSLTSVYKIPIPILASWRGMDDEPIEAQRPFNSRLPKLLEAYDIHYEIFSSGNDLRHIDNIIKKAYDENIITVALIKPECWDDPTAELTYEQRARQVNITFKRKIKEPTSSRLDAIRTIMEKVDDDTVVVSNIGVPSKETYASKDRPLNFYMLGSYTQATPIALGIALKTKRKVFVIDGDGSLLGSSVLSVVAVNNRSNLTIICLDNGTFGSTGDQISNAYSDVDMESVAKANGIKDTSKVYDGNGLNKALKGAQKGTRFIHFMILPGNSRSKNIPLSAEEIKKRFMDALR